MRTASNSPLTQKYGDKTTHVSITVLFVLKLIGSPVLNPNYALVQKNAGSQFPSVKNRVPQGAPCVVPKHATGNRV